MAKTKVKKPAPVKKQLKASPKAKPAAKVTKVAKATTKPSTKEVAKAPASPKSAGAKPPKAAKKESKAKAQTEELDLFDDGEVTESEELLEYQAELEISEESEIEVETDKDDLLEEDTKLSGSENEEEIVLTDADGNRYCRAKDCDQAATVDGYCRFHYLLLWKKIQIRKDILIDGKLEKYVEDLTSRYPDKFLEVLRKDLKTTKDFMAAIAELEIDESAGEGEFEEDAQTFIDEVRGLSDAASSSMEDDEF
ncbi:MAG: hypothetical protein ACK5V3_00080 [Bdellovibrionales bacterium]